MSTQAILNILIGCNAGLLAMFIVHLFKCRDTRVDIAVIKETLSRIENIEVREIESLRKAKHEHAQMLTRHEADLYVLKSKAEME